MGYGIVRLEGSFSLAPSRRAEGLGRVVVKSTAITVKITAIQELKGKEDVDS